MTRLFPGLVAAALVLQACSEAPSTIASSDTVAGPSVSREAASSKSIPDYFLEELFSWYAAKELGRSCKSLKLRSLAANEELIDISDRAQADGVTSKQIKKWKRDPAARKVAEEQVLAWAKSRDVTMGDLGSFCAAGKLEIAENTQIGKLLREN